MRIIKELLIRAIFVGEEGGESWEISVSFLTTTELDIRSSALMVFDSITVMRQRNWGFMLLCFCELILR